MGGRNKKRCEEEMQKKHMQRRKGMIPHQSGSFNIERLRDFVGLRMHLQILGDLNGD